jgi:hypothetical protein
MTKKQYYEQEMVCFRVIVDNRHVDNEILTRKEAEKRNKIYKHCNRDRIYVEYKEPKHIKVFLDKEFIRLQQAINR